MFNLVHVEKIVVAFLISTLLAGLVVIVYKKSHSSVNVRVENFDIDSLKSKEKVNINEADAADLMKLKGVGMTLAERIIDYRSSKGSFASIEDVKNVKGIGPALFERIKDDISIE